MSERLISASRAVSIKPEPENGVAESSGIMKREGMTAEEPIDIEDLIELEESKLLCPQDKVFEAVRKRYFAAFKQIVETVKQSTKLKRSLEDHARIAENADQDTFISRHDEFWASCIVRAVHEVENEMEKKEKMFEEIKACEKSEETEVFRRSILKPARKRHESIEANQEMTNNLVRDLKRHLKIPVSKKKRARPSSE